MLLELEEVVDEDSAAVAVEVPAMVVLDVLVVVTGSVLATAVTVEDCPDPTCTVVLPGPLSYDVTLPTLASLLTLPVT